MKIDIARNACVQILYRIDKEGAYSNIILDEYIQKNRNQLNEKDINLISEIVYGTITWKLTIDYIIQKYSKIKLKKISPWILNILRISVYQIVFLDKIPKSAAVNESVNLTKKYGVKSTGFVNAILRKVSKEDYEEIEELHLKYSMPLWLIEELKKNYDLNTVEQICINSNIRPKTTIRVNTLKITQEELEQKLKQNRIDFERTKKENFLNIKIRNLSELELFKKGYFSVQDISAGKPASVLAPKEGQIVLDMCSAPGGKTTYMAEIMKNKGEIYACDLYEKRLNLVKENAKRLGIDIIKTIKWDATQLNEEFVGKFDKILLDVPCMGIGVIKRKPDIKWKRKKEDIKEISEIQLKILKNCSKYLKKDGELVYSTCSILKEENDSIISKFLIDSDFEIKTEKNGDTNKNMVYSILPSVEEDGFFICKLKNITKILQKYDILNK